LNQKKNKGFNIRSLLLTISSILISTFILGCQQISNVQKQPETTKVVKKTKKPILTIKEKKERFKNILLPQIQAVYAELNIQYNEIKIAIQTNTQLDRIESLKKTYKAKSNEELLMALKPHPISLTLAQAAMESSWGTSRFFNKANNVFGIWSFSKKEPRIAANGQRGSKKIYLKKYPSIKDSVRDYYKNMGRSFAFKEFRQERLLSNNPYILVTKLDRYSEKGAEYGVELTAMMSYNKFLKYDDIFFEKPKKIDSPKTEQEKKLQVDNLDDKMKVTSISVEKTPTIGKEKS